MIRKIAALFVAGLLALSVAGCNEVYIQKLKLVVPKVPEKLWNCPILAEYPQVSKLTDSQVATLLIKLHGNNMTCRNSMDAVRRFLDEAGKLDGR